jgi:NAD-dependent oxidoreductase involved in siderophore biosynthesis
LFCRFRHPTQKQKPNQEVLVNPAPMALLSSGVPLSLLLDLVLGPNSEDLLSHERSDSAE